MEEHKNTPIIFKDALTYFYEKTRRIEASFSSKLLATINPNMPVWDVNVLNNLRIIPPHYKQQNRFNKTIDTYMKLQK
jgi:hypothetical protein